MNKGWSAKPNSCLSNRSVGRSLGYVPGCHGFESRFDEFIVHATDSQTVNLVRFALSAPFKGKTVKFKQESSTIKSQFL